MENSSPLPPHERSKKQILRWFFIITLVCLIVSFFSWVFYFRLHAFTRDAYVEGNMVVITPLHQGFITSIHTDDTFLVKKGQIIVEMDKTDAKIALDRATEELAKTVREVCQMFHEVFAYQAEIEVKKSELVKASQDYEHREGVLEEGGVSLENFEHAVAALRSSVFSLQKTESLYEKSLSMVQGTSIKSHPLVLAAVDAVRDAFVFLHRCNIYAPVDGLVAQRTIQVGMSVNKGDPLMSVIPLDQIWVNANFKETQMRHMRIGQKVKIYSDLYGFGVVYPGVIVGIPGGAGNAFSLLPPQNLSGNWIKIVQRLPVRVALDPDALRAHPLRIGLSMIASVNLGDQSGLLVPTTTAGSPLYETGIFEKEEEGDRALAQKIIEENLDPVLKAYFENPLVYPVYD